MDRFREGDRVMRIEWQFGPAIDMLQPDKVYTVSRLKSSGSICLEETGIRGWAQQCFVRAGNMSNAERIARRRKACTQDTRKATA